MNLDCPQEDAFGTLTRSVKREKQKAHLLGQPIGNLFDFGRPVMVRQFQKQWTR
jgi:hypothetical protein